MKTHKMFLIIASVILILISLLLALSFRFYNCSVEALETRPAFKSGDEIKRAFLSFDDGPTVYTEDILDLLQAHNAPAIFFLWGERITNDMTQNELLLKRMLNEGHYIGLHSMNHDYRQLYLEDNSPQEFITQMIDAQKIVYELTGYLTHLCRAPYGRMSGFTQAHYNEVANSKFRCVDWNIDPEDWKNDADEIFSQLVMQIQKLGFPPELMIVMHDVGEETIIALPKIIEFLRQYEYFITPYSPDHEFIFQNYTF